MARTFARLPLTLAGAQRLERLMLESSARDIAAAVHAGQTSAMGVARAALERVAERNPGLNAFAALDAEQTCREAAQIDARLGRGEVMPLAGVPVVIKDNIWVAGRIITQGSRLFEAFVPTQDAIAVSLLRQAGAVVLGIGTCSEFACKGVTNTPLHGRTLNPLDQGLTPGGSSGGPAVAVAAGMAPLALGTDAGGSSRRPPAHTGIVGFKPSQDAIAYGPGFAEPSPSFSVLAPMARSVADAALMFEVLVNGTTLAMPAAPAGDLKAQKIALAPTLGLDQQMDDACWIAFDCAAKAIGAAGFDVRPAAPVWPEGVDTAAVMPLQWFGLARIHGGEWTRAPERFDPDIAAQIEAGLSLTEKDLARARAIAAEIRTIMRSFLDDYDLILSATTPCAAWPIDRLGPQKIGGAPAGPRDHAAFTAQFNIAGLPALSLPFGTDGNLPLGLQLGAAAGRDRTVLAVAAALEDILGSAAPGTAKTNVKQKA